MEALKKTTTIETWIGFVFEPADESDEDVDLSQAKKFLSLVGTDLSHREQLLEHGFDVREVDSGRELMPRAARRVALRARDATGQKWLQIWNDRLVFNYLRKEGEYPGFQQVSEDSLGFLYKYLDFFPGRRVRRYELHRIDLLAIPCTVDETFELAEYLNLRPEVPPVDFGAASSVSFGAVVHPPGRDQAVEVSFQSVVGAEGHVTFRFDWQAGRDIESANDLEGVRALLNSSHDLLSELFRVSLTPKALELLR